MNPQTQALSVLVADQSRANSTPKSFTCPNNLPELTALLLKDLPAYSNRVIQRTQVLNQAAGIKNYIIIANKAKFEPLSLPRLQYDQIGQDPEQVFFTVLERQYIQGKIVEIQTYHWLFLTHTKSGWRAVMIFSRFGNAAENQPPSPPQETTNGIIGRGVQLWLRDCRANAVRSEERHNKSDRYHFNLSINKLHREYQYVTSPDADPIGRVRGLLPSQVEISALHLPRYCYPWQYAFSRRFPFPTVRRYY